MEHFSAVQSIIRAGLSGDAAAFEQQVMRLYTRLQRAGASREAATIKRLLEAAGETKYIQPSRVEVSRAHVSGEALTPDTNVPINRETGAALCEVHFPSGRQAIPIFEERVSATVTELLEEWSSPDALWNVGVEPTRSLLIFGPPGTGKTLTAHYIAERLVLPLVTARIDGLISSFLGTTARNIANLFDFANRYSCLLLLDEFDALAKVRDDPQEVGEIKRVVNSLLQNLDQRWAVGVTIAITNHDGLLDPAVWRRFETHVQFAEPGAQARTRMIERFLMPLKPEPAIFIIIAYCLEGLSGADLERICMSLKRTLALSRESHDGPGLFRALSVVLGRFPSQGNDAARILAKEPDAFISLIANESGFPLRQAEIGRATGYGQSKISDIKKTKRHLPLMEAGHA